MLLKELFEQQFPDQTQLDYRDRGAFSKVYNIKDNPHEIAKVTKPQGFRKNIEKDAFNKFAQALASNKQASSNPYLPRIRVVETDPKEHKYIIEKLLSFKQAFPDNDEHTIQMLWHICNKAFDDFKTYHKQLVSTLKYPSVDGEPKTIYNTDYLYGSLVILLQRALQGNSKVLTAIKDPQLKFALMFIKSLKANADIHEDNLMFRRGPTGIQMVLTDPVSGDA